MHSLVIYAVQPGSDKGEFTYNCFRLVGLRVDTFDQAQGSPINDAGTEGALEVRARRNIISQVEICPFGFE